MSGASLYTGLGFWSAEGHSLAVEYFAPVLERIRAEAIEGFNRTGAGGFEVGGVLFGSFEGDIVRILSHRPFACEYAMGPAFSLSERDQLRFESLLQLPDTDPELEGLEAVGWYHSHTRHGVYLSERDLEVHNRFFPGAGIALVVRPDVFGSVRAGFFFREADGSVRGDSSYCEFDVAGPSRAPGIDPPRHRLEAELPPLPPMPGLGLPEETPRAGRRGFPWVALLVALVLALAAAAAALYYGLLLPRPTMALEVRDLGGPVRISWDRNARPIAQARSGVMQIADGSENVEMQFDSERLRDGSVIYTPRSATLDVQLRVEGASGERHEESVRFVGRPHASEPAVPSSEPEPAASAAGSAEPEPTLDASQAEVQPQPEPVAHPALEKRPEPAKPEAPKTTEALARFRPPAQSTASPLKNSALPLPPSIRPAGAPVDRTAAAPVVENVPGPPPVLPPRETPKPVYTGPSRGRLIWTGEVRSNIPILINGNRASYGSVTGELPGVPVRIQVHPADLTARGLRVFTLNPEFRSGDSSVEQPGPHNGWNPTVYTWNPKRARSVTVTDAPSQANNWKGLTLRGDIDWTPVIIIDWQVASQ